MLGMLCTKFTLTEVLETSIYTISSNDLKLSKIYVNWSAWTRHEKVRLKDDREVKITNKIINSQTPNICSCTKV